MSDFLHGSIPNVDIHVHDERHLQMSFSPTLAASLLVSEPESVISEWLPSSLAGAEVVAMVEKSQRFLELLDCGESLGGGVEEQRPILIQ